MTRYDIITVGEILAEVLTEKTGQSLGEPGLLLGPYPSGAPAIAIDQAARMGARTAIISKIGADAFGKLNKDRLSPPHYRDRPKHYRGSLRHLLPGWKPTVPFSFY